MHCMFQSQDNERLICNNHDNYRRRDLRKLSGIHNYSSSGMKIYISVRSYQGQICIFISESSDAGEAVVIFQRPSQNFKLISKRELEASSNEILQRVGNVLFTCFVLKAQI